MTDSAETTLNMTNLTLHGAALYNNSGMANLQNLSLNETLKMFLGPQKQDDKVMMNWLRSHILSFVHLNTNEERSDLGCILHLLIVFKNLERRNEKPFNQFYLENKLKFIYFQVLLMFFTVFYVFVFISGLLGNMSVIIVIVRSKGLHCAMNYYLISLAIADVLIILLGNMFLSSFDSFFCLQLQQKLFLFCAFMFRMTLQN